MRQPLGVAGLIIAANTPIANVAWKVFPALRVRQRRRAEGLRGHARDRARVRAARARGGAAAGRPQRRARLRRGGGPAARRAPATWPSSRSPARPRVGRMIARVAGERLAKVCLELGGKNPLVVCDDADLEARRRRRGAVGVLATPASAAPPAAGCIVFDAVYDEFVELLLERTRASASGPGDEHDFGPVINERQLEQHARRRSSAREAPGATVLAGGERLTDPEHDGGFYMAPTLIEDAPLESRDRLHRAVRPDRHAAPGRRTSTRRSRRANDSPYGLTAAIWTAQRAPRRRSSSRGSAAAWRRSTARPTAPSRTCRSAAWATPAPAGARPGTEALDVYSDLKTVYVNHDPGAGLGAERGRTRPRARGLGARSRARTCATLAGHPLIAYSIAAARESGLFDAVVVSTDSEEIAEVARRYGAEVPGAAAGRARDRDLAGHRVGAAHARRARADGPDVRALLDPAPDQPVPRRGHDPPRLGPVRRARPAGADSIRAVELCREHPGKMWVIDGRADAPAARQQPGRGADALAPVPGAARGLRAELEPRDRLDADRRPTARSPASASCRSSPRASRASRSTTRTTGSRPSGWSRPAPRACRSPPDGSRHRRSAAAGPGPALRAARRARAPARARRRPGRARARLRRRVPDQRRCT